MDKLAMLGGTRAVPRRLRIRPWPHVTEEDKHAVQRVLDSGRFTAASSGEQEIAALEREWARAVETGHCLAVSNGTTALSLALAAAGVGRGDEVIVPALSFIASALAPLHLSAVPVFADVDPWTYNVDPEAVRAALSPRTRAIVVVHLHGLPAELDRIAAIARDHGVALIEDAAQAHGARYRDRPVGSFGAVNAFSLNVSKNLPTCGEGGLVTTDDDEMCRRAEMMRQFGEVIPREGERSYMAHLLGWNHKPNAIQCAFTRSQLVRFGAEAHIRAGNVERLLGRLAALPGLVTPKAAGDRTHAWHILRFRVDATAFGLDPSFNGPVRAALMRALRAEGVPASHYQLLPLPDQAVFQHPERSPAYPDTGGAAPLATDDHPNTRAIIEESFTIQKAHLHPEAGPLLSAYADAFEKVWQQPDAVRQYATGMEYQSPAQHALQVAEAELTLA